MTVGAPARAQYALIMIMHVAERPANKRVSKRVCPLALARRLGAAGGGARSARSGGGTSGDAASRGHSKDVAIPLEVQTRSLEAFPGEADLMPVREAQELPDPRVSAMVQPTLVS